MTLVLIEDELLAEATPAELAAYREWLEAQALDDAAADVEAFEADWRAWVSNVFPSYTGAGFAPHHEDFWRWVWAIEDGTPPEEDFVAVWPRGGAKSTSAELACVALGARRRRRYGLYVCETQDQADDHVRNVAGMLELPGVERLYPDLARREVGKYGNVKGWRRNRLWTASGFVLDALGLDTAARGVKLDDQRPDLFVLDDLDSELDTLGTVEKKITTLTRKLLPAGAGHAAVVAIQNLVHENSIFARFVDGRADFLARRFVSGPVPAIEGLVTERIEGRSVIVEGTPTWAGQDIAACQHSMDEFGETAFRSEAQHETSAPAGGMFDHIDFRRCRWAEVPWHSIERTVVWVDPAVTNKDSSDSMGIQADTVASDGTVYRLFSWEQRTSPLDALKRAITKAYELSAEHVGVETDQGGDTWESVYREALAAVLEEHPDYHQAPVPKFTSDKAGAGHGPKVHRAQLMLTKGYDRGRIVHVIGTHEVLERALRRFPKTKPLDLVDASYWSWQDLAQPHKRVMAAVA